MRYYRNMLSRSYKSCAAYFGYFVILVLGIMFSQVSHAERLSGFMVYGHEVRSFQPCDSDRIFWIHASGEHHRNLLGEYARLGAGSYEKLYAEIDGEFSDQMAGMLSRDFNGVINLKRVHQLSKPETNSCESGNTPMASENPSRVHGSRTFVFNCENGFHYVVSADPVSAWVFRPQGSWQLSPIKTNGKSGYANDHITILMDGQRALISESDSTGEMSCQNDSQQAVWEHAKLNGADFRAVGNEPPWHMEIMYMSTIVLFYGYDQERSEVPLPVPQVDAAARTTVWDAGQISLKVIGKPCRDSMSGEQFESTVIVTTGKKTLHGCGRALH